jgi:hypothetical protein
MELKEKYATLLEFFDNKVYDHNEVSSTIDIVINKVKEKCNDHQLGIAWIIIMLFKKGKSNLLELDQLIDELSLYMNNYDDYASSLTTGIKDITPYTYYNAYLYKKIKGE